MYKAVVDDFADHAVDACDGDDANNDAASHYCHEVVEIEDVELPNIMLQFAVANTAPTLLQSAGQCTFSNKTYNVGFTLCDRIASTAIGASGRYCVHTKPYTSRRSSRQISVARSHQRVHPDLRCVI